MQVETERLIEIDLTSIRVNPSQPRRQFQEEELQELADSIRSVGLIHPPTVREVDGGYELISGERRVRASECAGLEKITVFVRDACEEFSAKAALVENVQRVDLNPIEIAQAMRALMLEYGYSQEELADTVGKKRSTVANYLRLLTLPGRIQESVFNHSITMGHAKAVLSLEGLDQQIALYELIIRDQLSVREAERAAQKMELIEKSKKNPLKKRDVYLEELAFAMQKKFGTKVEIQGKGKKGKICIDYYSLDDLDRLLELLQVEYDG